MRSENSTYAVGIIPKQKQNKNEMWIIPENMWLGWCAIETISIIKIIFI